MGAVDVYRTFPGKLALHEVDQAFKEVCEQERWENGADPYSGSIDKLMGYTFENKIYPSVNKALENIRERTDKHGKGILTKAYKDEGVRIEPSPLLAKLRAEHKDKWTFERELIEGFLAEVKAAKSKTLGCKKCGSSLNRMYLKGYFCPLCNGELRTETQLKKTGAAIERWQKTKDKLEAETERLHQKALAKLPPSDQLVWVLAGWVPY